MPPLEISLREASTLLEEKSGAPRLIDVRDPDEFEYCRIRGAELIPLATIASQAAARLPDKDAPILLYCHHGMRSMRAAEILRGLGYWNTRSVAGGINRWSVEIDPSVPRY
jgi:adenylyltransferase/sulfurtransferase